MIVNYNFKSAFQALTLLGANDTICMERLETLGDCFLKFITSFSIFVRHPNMKEGEMTRQRSLLIGNNNLTTCGMKCKIPGCIQVSLDSINCLTLDERCKTQNQVLRAIHTCI